MKKQIMLLSAMLIGSSTAAHAATSGNCGPQAGGDSYSSNCTWTLDDSGKLTISGSGEMADFAAGDAPWGQNYTNLEISGISSIGTFAFYESKKLHTVFIPESVEKINSGAFYNSSIEEVNFSDNSYLKTIGGGCFYNAQHLTSINIPSGITQIGANAFNKSGITSLVLPDSVFSVDDLPADQTGYFHGLSFYALSHIENVYCSKESKKKCEEYFQNEKTKFWKNEIYHPIGEMATLSVYVSDGNQFYANGKWYKNTNDIGTENYIKKRIYTIDEANMVSGKKNSIRLRYK